MKLPFFKFYPGDWVKDASLRRCSYIAKGVLMEVLCIMFDMPERGVLITANKPWTIDEIIQAIGGDQTAARIGVEELLSNRALKRRSDGAIYSARMVKDEETRSKRAEGGRLGGNPNLKVNLTNNHRLKPPPNLLLVLESVPESSKEGRKGCGETIGENLDVIGLEFPQHLITHKFMVVWNDWVEFRMSLKPAKDFVDLFQKTINFVGSFPEETAIAMIQQSRRNQWQGIFEVKMAVKANGTANGHLSIGDLRTVMAAKEKQANEIKCRHCSEVATGMQWDDQNKRIEHSVLRKEIKELNQRIASFA